MYRNVTHEFGNFTEINGKVSECRSPNILYDSNAANNPWSEDAKECEERCSTY